MRKTGAPSPGIAALSRATAFSLGAFTLANLAMGCHRPGLDANIWWIDLRPLHAWIANPFLLSSGVVLLLRGVVRVPSSFHRRVVSAALILLAVAAAANAITFYRLILEGAIVSAFPLPFSLIVSLTCAVLAWTLRSSEVRLRAGHRVVGLAWLAVIATAFPIAQMWCFGSTDYRRHGDVAVVFGAGVYPDGTPSLALSDRVLTASNLVREGRVSHLLLSGGPGMGSVHEVDAMKRLAIDIGGVPESAILVDRHGLDTRSTVANTCRILGENGPRRILAVSHFYHLPRIKMTFQRAGLDALTVPAKESRPLLGLPYFVAREVAAFWYYYATPTFASRGKNEPRSPFMALHGATMSRRGHNRR